MPALACCAVLAVPAWSAQGDPIAGKRKTLTCNACHGVSGFKSMPRLGGQAAGYIVSALGAYKAGKRSHATMRDVAGALSERDMADLGAYYASISRAIAAEAPELPAAAAACTACHGAQGDQPAADDVAIIAGQNAAYLELVLREYRAGTRTHEVMQAQVKDLDDAALAQLAAWFAALPGLLAK